VEGDGGLFQVRYEIFQIDGPFVVCHSVIRNNDEVDAAKNVFHYHPINHSSKLGIHFEQLLSNLM